jgi:hypothetical protein
VSQLKKTDLPAGPKNKSKSRDKGRSRGRGKGKSKRRNQRRQALNRKPFYQRPSGGWIARELGSQRVFSTKKKARDALTDYKASLQAYEASLAQSLGGGVAGGYKCIPIVYKCTPCGHMYHPTNIKTSKPGISLINKNQQRIIQQWPDTKTDYEGLPEWQSWDYDPRLHEQNQDKLYPRTEMVMKITWDSGLQEMKNKLQKYGVGSGKHDPPKLSEIINFKFKDQEMTKIEHLEIIPSASRTQEQNKQQWPKTRQDSPSLKAMKMKHKTSRQNSQSKK